MMAESQISTRGKLGVQQEEKSSEKLYRTHETKHSSTILIKMRTGAHCEKEEDGQVLSALWEVPQQPSSITIMSFIKKFEAYPESVFASETQPGSWFHSREA